MRPEEIEMNIRKALINQIIMDSQSNELLDDELVLDLFIWLKDELELFKYSGKTERLIAKMTQEKEDNVNGYQAFLLKDIAIGFTVFQFLISKFS